MRRFAVLSLALHIAAFSALLLWLARGPAPVSGEQVPGAVELVMLE
jgi:hypothetical protein